VLGWLLTQRERPLLRNVANDRSWRDRAGRGIGSDYPAMERSTSQSGGERKFNAVARNSRIVEDEADVRSPTECAATFVAAHSMNYMVSFLRGASSDWYMEIV
jgi:hypothetical protein